MIIKKKEREKKCIIIRFARSNWNMYIQKTRSQRKGVLQLGVYLHRQSIPSQEEPQGPYSFSRYSDKRKVVKTWFKIYCPSRGPKHALTLFQSSPDNFSVLQSWVKFEEYTLETQLLILC